MLDDDVMVTVGPPPVFVIVTVSAAELQPSLMVHAKEVTPTVSPVTADVGDDGVVTVPVPVTIDHVPVPVEGVFPASRAELLQIVWSGPALTVIVPPVGSVRVTVTVSGQLLLSKAYKVYTPAAKPVKLCVPALLENVATVVPPLLFNV